MDNLEAKAMKPILSAIAAGVVCCAATAAAGPVQGPSGPMVLDAEAMDRVTAGIALLLPAVQQARSTRDFPLPRGLAIAPPGLDPTAGQDFPPRNRDHPPAPVEIRFPVLWM
jgi:hypothetical protein